MVAGSDELDDFDGICFIHASMGRPARCLLAQAHLGQADNAAALNTAKTAASLAPQEEWPQRLISIAQDRLGRKEEALLAAREAVRLAPHTWQGFVQLAYVASRSESRLPEAHAAAKQAVLLAPHEAATHVAAGTVAAKCEDREGAKEAYQRALAIDPQNVTAHNDLAALNLRYSSFGRAAALANAAAGFATVLGTDPRAKASRHNLDLVVRVFLAWITYFVFLDAFLVDRVIPNIRHPDLRFTSLLLLVVPAVLAFRVVHRLRLDMRAYLWHSLFHPKVRIPVALDLVAIVMLIAAATGPKSASGAAAGGAVGAALISRVLLYVQIRHTPRLRGVSRNNQASVRHCCGSSRSAYC